MKHRILTVIVASLLVLGICVPGAQRVTAGTTNSSLRVAISSNYPGDTPQYTLTVTLDADVFSGSSLVFTFDDAVGRTDGIAISSSVISVDGTPLSKNAGWQVNTLTMTVPQDLAAGTEHTVIISEDAGIQNPWATGHYRIALENSVSKTTLISNYYSVTTVSHLVPLAFDKVVEYAELTGVKVTFKTGRNGALVGHDLIRGPNGLMVYPTTEDTMTVRLSAGLSTLWTKGGSVKLLPAYTESPFAMAVLSSTIYDTNDASVDLWQLVLSLPHNLPANTQMSLYVMFATAQDVSALSDAEYVKLYTSKETTLVTVPPQPASSGSASQPGETSTADTTVPTVTWTSTTSTLLPRLVTLDIAVTEENLDEAWFSGGTGSFIHTRLSTGDNTIMVINRTGIHGTIVASDKAGNTTTVSVDIPAPSGT
jgi:hypothetical protein